MCGILGGNNLDWNYSKGILSMKHRGPDGQRVIRFNEFVLAFARLAIIDLSRNGMQPMFSENEDICIVFNGEIYGYKKIREDLIKKGYNFKTLTDTEVIINSYLEWGDEFIDRIDGMFSIAIYDRKKRVIKLFRDRVGIKPLYYYYDGKNFAFSSELKGIINTCQNCNFQIDETAIYDYINYLYIPEPKTLYKNIFKLPPACKLVYDIKNARIKGIGEYWKLNINKNIHSERKQKDLIEELHSLIHKNVEQQMIADVEVGTFLSGGVDSSIITYVGSTINANTKAFSMGFTDKRKNELDYANTLATKHNIPLCSHIISKDDINNIYYNIKDWYDEPFGDASAYPTYLVSKMSKQYATVVLTGDGGDEVFGGYNRYKVFSEILDKNRVNNRLVSRLYENTHLKKYIPDYDKLLLEDIALVMKNYMYEVLPDKLSFRKKYNIPKDYDDCWSFRRYYDKSLPVITRSQYLDFKTYLPGDILTKVDRASMAVSMETRVPFLSREIVEFSFGLSQEDRCPKGELKGLLKKAYTEEITRKLAYRRKQGFSIPKSYVKDTRPTQVKLLEEIWKL